MVYSKPLKLSQLKLDQQNYRLGKTKNQPATFQAMLEDQDGLLANLARDIIDNGLSPGESIWVIPDSQEADMFVVLEGNRRITALKVLETPGIAVGTPSEKKFANLAKDYAQRTPRYPGGKGRLAQYVIDVFKLNDLTGGHYVETYAGGAGIAFPLLYLEYASHIHLNDLNRSVYAFWKSVCTDTDALCKLVRDKPLTVAQWKKQRAIQTAADVTQLELGFSTLYLNRTNRSGILKGGIIGGLDQTGEWKLDARFNRKDLIRRIEKIASFTPRISLYNKDAADFLRTELPNIPKKSLIYLDPPYYVKGSELYENHYKPADHAKIATLVSKIKQQWIVSYDNEPAIRKLYKGYEWETFGLRYSVQDRYSGKEIMIFCPGLETPASVEPWRGMAA